MNFLSHFQNELPCDDPYFACGVIFPDILYNYSRRNHVVVKLHPDKLTDDGRPELQSLKRGVQAHYNADKVFHSSGFFDDETTHIEMLIKMHPFRCFPRRLFAFSHVFLELMLDRKIIIQDRIICDSLYNLLDLVDLQLLSRFIGMNTAEAHGRQVAAHFNRFREIRFLYDYAIDERLIALLERINMSIGNPPMDNDDKNAFLTVICDYEKTIFPREIPKFHTYL